MHRMLLLLCLILLVVPFASAEDSIDLTTTLEEEDAPTASPTFLPGTDSGGAGVALSDCRLPDLCVVNSQCREIYQNWWACAWREGSECDSIWCESGL